MLGGMLNFHVEPGVRLAGDQPVSQREGEPPRQTDRGFIASGGYGKRFRGFH